MKVLVVGGGGREHAIVWKLAKSPQIDELYAAPGNPGIERLATCVNIAVEDIPGLAEFVKKNNIDLTVVGPEAPLVAGIVDEFKNRGLAVFGPNKAAAQIEGSKIFSKKLMKKYNIPTADYKVFEDPKDAISYIDTAPMPIVVKADGLAAGKGVIIAPDRSTAKEAVKTMMIDKAFGKSGSRIVLEEYLEGPEVTVLAFCDGKRAVPMVSSRDHKRVFDNNKGPNTGGMGAVSPAPAYTPEIAEIVERDIIQGTIDAMASEGAPFQGVLYTGLMITKNGPKVLEYNCRFGDPEAQVVIPRLKTDLVEVMQAVIDGDLTNAKIEWKSEVAVCVVIASGGYPGHYETGKVISGLDDAEKNGSIVFHAGTAEKDGKIITAGGRVLGVTALGKDVDEARKLAYESVSKIRFEGMHYRKDIGL
ncbi:phosphoribosylamine--glycine ligase [Tepidanaerobacter syntrophicus]|uniref:phosphoribosylamine--glycine ligase n=1 Tax=Tepidanaerobacter syntrophicus TaxID=224999 RepID=UPI0022EDD19A|nr:phosphoribosylamine--glycine ligase [Tepidanaerobacter syntrophicus]GLI18484.1 phosphoribosylamine--glycine ligase [Tepidanaerobacter syntrophicus]